jgi:hypothetical protein
LDDKAGREMYSVPRIVYSGLLDDGESPPAMTGEGGCFGLGKESFLTSSHVSSIT